MFTDNTRHISLGIAEAHRQADLERSFRRGRAAATPAGAPTNQTRVASEAAVVVPAVTAPDAALIAAGERSDALLTPACGPCQSAHQAA